MRGAAPVALAAFLAGVVPSGAAPVRVGGPPAVRSIPRLGVRPFRAGPRLDLRRGGFGVGPFLRRRFPPNLPPLLLPPPPPDEFIQPEGPGVSPLIEGTPDDLPALSHGFHFSVNVGLGQTFAVPPTLTRFIQVGQALGRCFTPPTTFAWGSVTLRVAFKRDGTVFGVPRVPYSDAATSDQKTELADSLLAGLKHCAPLPISASLGSAVAGEIFAIRFIHEDKR